MDNNLFKYGHEYAVQEFCHLAYDVSILVKWMMGVISNYCRKCENCVGFS